MQGDIIAIYDGSGNCYATYGYDSWGRGTIFTNVDDIANINPFKYRGYYFDGESNLYYLNSRYYDPEIGRFISSDSIDYITPESINGLNLYVYCGNNPVMYYDPNGTIALSLLIGIIIGATIGAIIGGVAFYNLAKSSGYEGAELFGWTMLGIVGGGIIGGLLGALIVDSLPAISAFLSSNFIIGSYLTASGELVAVSASGLEIAIGIADVALLGLGGYVFSRIGKSGGYRVDHYYPNDHEPTHVHIRGDDIPNSHGIRVGMDGKPLPGEADLPPGARKALKNLWEQIIKALAPWIG